MIFTGTILSGYKNWRTLSKPAQAYCLFNHLPAFFYMHFKCNFILSVSLDRLERELPQYCVLFCKSFVVNKVLECFHASLASAECCGAGGETKTPSQPHLCSFDWREREKADGAVKITCLF